MFAIRVYTNLDCYPCLSYFALLFFSVFALVCLLSAIAFSWFVFRVRLTFCEISVLRISQDFVKHAQ